MAVTHLSILNPADKTRQYTVAIGQGAITNTDVPATDLKKFPIGSQYTDVTNKKFYVRTAGSKVAADWTLVGPAGA